MKYNYVFFNVADRHTRRPNPDGYNTICAADLAQLDNVRVVSYPLDYATYPVRFFYDLHHTPRINRYIRLPFKRVWYPFYFKTGFQENKPLCFVVSGSYITVDYQRFLKKKYPSAKLVRIHRDLIDLWLAKSPEYTEEILNELYDLRLSYDENDARAHGILGFDEFESKVYVPRAPDYPTSDVFFAGVAKDRLNKLFRVYDKLTAAGLKCSYYITGVPREQRKPLPNVEYADQNMTYRQMLYRTVNARCILEVNQGGAVGYTSRFLEAVLFSKKLLTDNGYIKKSKFYDPRYIQCFTEPEAINTAFVTADVGDIDYHYSGEYSPIRLIEKIDRELSARDEG